MLLEDIDKWMDVCAVCVDKLSVSEIDVLVRKMEGVNVSKWEGDSDDEKENMVEAVEGGSKWALEEELKDQIMVNSIYSPMEVDSTVMRIDGSTDVIDGNDNCSEPDDDVDGESVVGFQIKDDCSQYWKFDDKRASIEERLLPQVFRHHKINTARLNKDYHYIVNRRCPMSPRESQLNGNQLMQDSALRSNAAQYRYKREKGDTVQKLCRLCLRQRWINGKEFTDHMALAHGIVHMVEYGLVALPPPVALYKQQLGRLKFYHAKCSKCLSWIRLGQLAEVPLDKPQVVEEHARSVHIEGLYSNYFFHFMKCALET